MCGGRLVEIKLEKNERKALESASVVTFLEQHGEVRDYCWTIWDKYKSNDPRTTSESTFREFAPYLKAPAFCRMKQLEETNPAMKTTYASMYELSKKMPEVYDALTKRRRKPSYQMDDPIMHTFLMLCDLMRTLDSRDLADP